MMELYFFVQPNYRFAFDLFLFYLTRALMSTDGQYSDLHNEVLTVKEVASYLRVSRVTVWRWCQQGTIPALRVGRTWRIRRQDIAGLVHIPEEPETDHNSNLH